jgi:hypothetical protein
MMELKYMYSVLAFLLVPLAHCTRSLEEYSSGGGFHPGCAGCCSHCVLTCFQSDKYMIQYECGNCSAPTTCRPGAEGFDVALADGGIAGAIAILVHPVAIAPLNCTPGRVTVTSGVRK